MEVSSQNASNRNWTWIKTNKALAEKFSKENNDTSEYSKEIVDQIARIGDLRVHLRTYEGYLEYSILLPKKSPRKSLICVLEYNQDILGFKTKMEKLFKVFKKEIDLIKKDL